MDGVTEFIDGYTVGCTVDGNVDDTIDGKDDLNVEGAKEGFVTFRNKLLSKDSPDRCNNKPSPTPKPVPAITNAIATNLKLIAA